MFVVDLDPVSTGSGWQNCMVGIPPWISGKPEAIEKSNHNIELDLMFLKIRLVFSLNIFHEICNHLCYDLGNFIFLTFLRNTCS